jgi:hypothetical protein
MMEILRFLKSPENWADINFSNSRTALISSIQNDIMNSRVSATVVRLDYLYPGEASDLGIWRGMSQPDFNLNNLKRFVDEMVRYSSIDMLVQGNTNTEYSKRLFGQVSQMLNVGDGYYTDNNGKILVRRLENVINEQKLAIRSFNTYTEDNHMIEKYRVYSYFLDTLHVYFSIVGVNKFHKKLYFSVEEGCPLNLSRLTNTYVSLEKSYNFNKKKL